MKLLLAIPLLIAVFTSGVHSGLFDVTVTMFERKCTYEFELARFDRMAGNVSYALRKIPTLIRNPKVRKLAKVLDVAADLISSASRNFARANEKFIESCGRLDGKFNEYFYVAEKRSDEKLEKFFEVAETWASETVGWYQSLPEVFEESRTLVESLKKDANDLMFALQQNTECDIQSLIGLWSEVEPSLRGHRDAIRTLETQTNYPTEGTMALQFRQVIGHVGPIDKLNLSKK